MECQRPTASQIPPGRFEKLLKVCAPTPYEALRGFSTTWYSEHMIPEHALYATRLDLFDGQKAVKVLTECNVILQDVHAAFSLVDSGGDEAYEPLGKVRDDVRCASTRMNSDTILVTATWVVPASNPAHRPLTALHNELCDARNAEEIKQLEAEIALRAARIEELTKTKKRS